MKKTYKRLLAAILLVCTVLSLCGCNFAVVGLSLLWLEDKKGKGIEQYEKDCAAYPYIVELLPPVDGFPDAGETVYHSRQRDSGSEGFALFVTYPEDLYSEKKAAVLSEYEFLEAPILEKDGDQIIPAAEFSYKTFQMKVTDRGKEDFAACKAILMIGYDDAACRIVYCLFEDTSRDYIAEAGEDGTEAMQDFMSEYFYWI